MIKHPFPGLRPFETDEDLLFFGRDDQSDEILKRLRCNRFVAVVGTSGSGKSSLIKAGLLPSLHGGFMVKAGSRWRIAVFRPGDHPVHNLAVALSAPDVLEAGADNGPTRTRIIETTLRRSGLGLLEAVRQARMPAQENLLIVVDQFEELFRFTSERQTDELERRAAAFVKLLIEAAKQDEVPIYIVITMRSDFLGHCARLRELPEIINEGLYLIPLMTRPQHREAIEGPIAVAGGKISPALVNRLLNDIGENPEQLPIMQHALMRTWEHWTNNHENDEPLDLRQYEAVGGMAEALSKHADEAYYELSEEHQALAQKIFRALTEKRPDNPGVRRPTRVTELCAIAEASEADVIHVVENFRRPGRSFLMPPSSVPLNADSLIDISHESLIAGWNRLRTWVENEALSAAIYQRVASTAELYYKDQAGLWRDPDLKIALGWQEKARPNKAWGKHYHAGFEAAINFLKESKQAVEEQVARLEKERRRALLRTRVTACILALFFILATAAAGYAFRQNNLIQAQKAVIEAQRNKSEDLAKNLGKEVVVRQQAEDDAKDKKELAEGALQGIQVALAEANTQRKIADLAREQAVRQEQIARDRNNLFWSAVLRQRIQNREDKETIVSLADSLIQRSSPLEAVRWREIKANALTYIHQHEDAEAELSEALKVSPDSTDLRMTRGYMYMLTGNTLGSIQDFDSILTKDPKSALAYLNKSISQGIKGDYGSASTSLQTAIDNMTPGTYETLFESEVCPEVLKVSGFETLTASERAFGIALHYELANMEAFQGADDFVQKLNNAHRQPYEKEAYLTAINWAWLHMRTRKEDYGGLVGQGAIWEKMGPEYCGQAQESYKRFREMDKKESDPRYRGLAEWAKQRQAVLGQRCRSTKWDPELDVQTLASQAKIAYESKKYDEANEKLTQAIKLDPKNIYLFLRRALVKNALHDFPGSKEDATVALNLSSQHPAPQAQLLVALASTDQTDSEDLLRKLVEQNPRDVEALDWLSTTVEKKDPAEAIKLLDQLTKLQPSADDLYYRKAALLAENKRYPEALQSINAAIGISRRPLYFIARLDIEKNLATGPDDLARRTAAVLEDLGDYWAWRGRPDFALSNYERSLKSLTPVAKDECDASRKVNMAVMMHKIINLIEQQPKNKAVEALEQMKREYGSFDELRTLLDDKIKRLSE
jgi:Flp pilus assembly protein TadD